MSQLTNKIDANDRTIYEVLDNKKYSVDYFQREYKWEERHIEQLIFDLTSAFMNDYRPEHKPKEVDNYNSYYLGPFVISIKDGKRSIIDGQQRLTSLSLLLIYLNHLQKDLGLNKHLENMIFSEKYEVKSFNIQVDEREKCLNDLFTKGEYILLDDDDESTQNMVNRYINITQGFPEELKNGVLSYFIDWLKYRVVLVEIIAYSDENAYTIFETMNDRGLNLTPTEMLKGFILSKFSDPKKRQKANELWKEAMQKLHVYDKDEDQRFFQAWLRGQYADSIRPGKAGSKNEDFEKIGTRFHSWVRDNLERIGLDNDNPESFEQFMEKDFKFFLKQYLIVKKAEQNFDPAYEYNYYITRGGIADSLRYPLLLAPLRIEDNQDTINQKLHLVARYIETFVVRRSVNFRLYAASSIRYSIYTLVKEIRRKEVSELKAILKNKLDEMEETFEGFSKFRMHKQNPWFVKYLLSRITSYIEEKAGISSSWEKYYLTPGAKSYEIEHIWANKFQEHRDEFEQESDFYEKRNRIGGLLLLPRGTNQSFSDKPYQEKLPHYFGENLLAQTLYEITYKNNPNFLNMKKSLNLPFKPHTEFKMEDMEERQNLYGEICKLIWSWE